jgi:hypothetical protein
MIQNLIALAIVFLATGYVIFAVVRSVTAKKTSPCIGCKGCGIGNTYGMPR